MQLKYGRERVPGARPWDVFRPRSRSPCRPDHFTIKDPDSGAKTIPRDIKGAGSLFYGEHPAMTDNGTFIINGNRRVIVSQFAIGSPGRPFFSKAPTIAPTFLGKIIPYPRLRGWNCEYDTKEQFSTCVIRPHRRKFPRLHSFLRALGA